MGEIQGGPIILLPTVFIIYGVIDCFVLWLLYFYYLVKLSSSFVGKISSALVTFKENAKSSCIF